MEVYEDYYKRVTMNPHERLFLKSRYQLNDQIQVDALHDGKLVFTGGNNVINNFEGIDPEGLEFYDSRQPFVVTNTNSLTVDGNGIVLTTPNSEMSNTCVYITSDSEGKITITGGQDMIHGIIGIELSKFSNQRENHQTIR